MVIPHSNTSSSVTRFTSKIRLRIVVASVIFYFLLCYLLPIYSHFTGMPILSVIPVIAIAWLYGSRLGAIAGLAFFPVNALVLTVIGINWIDNMVGTGGGLVGSISLICIGSIVGRLSDLSCRLRAELLGREAVEQELISHRENLEHLVNDKVRDLQESQGRFRAISDNSPDAIIITYVFGTIRYCNSGTEKMFGYGLDEMLGQNSTMFLPPGIRDEEQVRRDSMARSGMHAAISATIESDMVRKDGAEFPVQFSLYSWPLEGELFYSMSIRDITERRQAESGMLAAADALQRSRNFFQNVFDASGDGMYVTDDMGKITFANRALCQMLDYEHCEFIGMNAIDNAAEMYVGPVNNTEEQELFSHDFTDPFETAYIRKDGTLLIVESRIANVPVNGKPGAGLIVTLRDITERKCAEEEISRARDFLETLFKTSPDAIIAVDAAGIITAVNDSVYDVYGYHSEELIGQPVTMIPRAEEQSQDRHKSLIEQVRKQGIVRNFEEVSQHRDGHQIYIETSVALLQNPDGTSAGAISSTRDITERKRAEDEIKQARDFLETTFKMSPDAIIVTDDAGLIVSANDSVYDVYGYRPEEIIGQHVSMMPLDDEQSMSKNIALVELVYEQGIVRCFETTRKHKDGHCIQVETSVALMKDPDGTVLGSISSTRDITDRIRLQDQLRQAQKMEAIGTLAGGIAHDFNNILGAIIGYTELSQHDADCAPQIRNNLDQVLNAAERARNLVKQILAFSRKSQSEVKPLQVHVILKEALKLMRASIPANIEIKIDMADARDVVLAEATQLHQIIVNLCKNAAHAMEKSGGVMTVELNPIVLQDGDVSAYSDLQPGLYVQLTVRDTGMGIELQNLSRIFEPFYTTKDVGKGTGMGLAVVHGIVKSLKGDIKVYSEPGRGTVFNVLLPSQDEDVAAEAVVVREPPRGHESVLLVDDELALMDVGAHMLRSLGYQVTAVQQSSEALELFARDPNAFDLVFTDQAMPGLSGFDLAQQVLGLRPDISVILCTGYSDLVTEAAALAAGIKAFVIKPLSRLKIGETIRRVMEEAGSD